MNQFNSALCQLHLEQPHDITYHPRCEDRGGLDMCSKCQLYLYPGLPSDAHFDGAGKSADPRSEDWRKPMKREMNEQGWTWEFMEGIAADRPQWHSLVVALCANTHEEDFKIK